MRATIVMVGVLVILAGAATAAEVWMDLGLGRNTLTLNELTDGSATYRGYDLLDGSMDAVTAPGATVAFTLNRNWSLGVAYDRLVLDTTGVVPDALDRVGGEKTMAAHLPSHALRAVARWRPLRIGRVVWSVVGGLGIVDVSGTSRTVNDPAIPLDGEVEGTGILAELGLSCRVMLRPRLGVYLDAGMRRASIGSLTVGTGPLRADADGATAPFDLGGGYLKGGVTFLLPSDVASPD